jgi:hypothetical protein
MGKVGRPIMLGSGTGINDHIQKLDIVDGGHCPDLLDLVTEFGA